MLLSAINHYQQDFDLLLSYLSNFTNQNGLMCWQQVLPEGTTTIIPTPDPPGAGMTSATDGDLDIAHALLIASEKWTHRPDSKGMAVPADYKQRALKIMDSIWKHTVNDKLKSLYLGDWVSPTDAKYSNVTRVSDFNLLAIYTFAKYDKSHNWTALLDNLISILYQLFDKGGKGLFPDFAVFDENIVRWVPVKGQILETEYDGCYSYNACRVPWRIAAYYKATKDPRVEPILRWFADWGTKLMPKNIYSGYNLQCEPLNNYNSLAFIMPIWSAIHVTKSAGAEKFYLNAMSLETDPGYFEEAILNLCLSQCF